MTPPIVLPFRIDYHIQVGHEGELWIANVEEFPGLTVSAVSAADVLRRVSVTIDAIIAAEQWERDRLAIS